MKFSKASAIGASAALVVASVLGVGIAASAVTVDVPVTAITPETNPYAVNAWFQGTPPTGVTPGTLTQDTTGLIIQGRNQVLYGHSITGVSGDEFETFINEASFVGTGPLDFQVPVFLNGTGLFTTLHQVGVGTPSTAAMWTSSQSVGGLTAFQAYPFADIMAAIDGPGGSNTQILAFGVLVLAGSTATLESLTWGPDTWNFATPQAVVPPAIQGPVTFTG